MSFQEIAEKSEAEVAAALERRREQGRRLQEMQARQRAEKVISIKPKASLIKTELGQLEAKMAELEEYKALLALRGDLKPSEFQIRIAETTPFETEGELQTWVKRTESDIRRKQKKDAGEDGDVEEEPSFPLVDRPDEELTEEELKDKRRQRLMKAGWEARVKAREEKKRERERRVSASSGVSGGPLNNLRLQEEEQRQEENERETDLTGWSSKLREEQSVSRLDVVLIGRLKSCSP